jgi:hypothetical protein
MVGEALDGILSGDDGRLKLVAAFASRELAV